MKGVFQNGLRTLDDEAMEDTIIGKKVDNSLGELGWDLDLHRQKQHLMIYLSFNDGKR